MNEVVKHRKYIGIRFNNGLWMVVVTKHPNMSPKNNVHFEEAIHVCKTRTEAEFMLKHKKQTLNRY